MTRNNFDTITPAELNQLRQDSVEHRLIDVRESAEWAIAHIEGAELMPMSQGAEWVRLMDRDAAIVVMCHHGMRSAQVCAYLAREGFAKVSNLEGGIESWSRQVDPTVPRY